MGLTLAITLEDGNGADYWHISTAQHMYKEGCLDFELRGFKDNAARVAGKTPSRVIGNQRIDGDDYSEDMTLAAMYAHIKTLDDLGGLDFTAATDHGEA